MKMYRYSPIRNKDELLEAIKYTHIKCSELCKVNFGIYLPVSGNIGIFCHYDDEYEFLTSLRQEMTEDSNNWNKKYYKLHTPIEVKENGDVPSAIYTHLYIRKPEQDKTQVGDVDFVLEEEKFNELKQLLSQGEHVSGMEILDRPDLDLVKLYDPNVDVLSFIGKEYIEESILKQQ